MENRKIENHWQRISSFLGGDFASSRSSIAFLICILVATLAYRIRLTLRLFDGPIRPFDFNPGASPYKFFLVHLPYDMGLVLACFLILWLLSRLSRVLPAGWLASFLTIFWILFLQVALVLFLIIHMAHVRLLFDAQVGLNYAMAREGFADISFGDNLKLIEIRDYLFLTLPMALFWLVWMLPLAWKKWLVNVCVPLMIFLTLPAGLAAYSQAKRAPDEIRFNPAYYLLADMVHHAFNNRPPLGRTIQVVDETKSGMQQLDPVYARHENPIKILPPRSPQPWNILLFVMESVGTRYLFDTSLGNRPPMPFVQQLVPQSWFSKNHYTASNFSTKALFSILSGLYDLFSRQTFSLRPDAQIYSLADFLPARYEKFLVTPASVTWYFPSGFVQNGNFGEIHSFENLNFKIKEGRHAVGRYIARDEVQTVDFFIQRMQKAREPFLGIYLSFAAHFPYFDYPDYRILPEGGSLITRYYNNLYLLDRLIQRIYEALQKQGRLKRTLLVLVGDHGQAFGQHHPNNYMHFRYSYNENLEAPAIFYQPAVFKPKRFSLATSHVDILPTLLDALRIPYNPVLFDGESLFQNQLRRKYLFFYGHEESISSLSTDRIKVQISLKENKCWAFDLKKDPGEKNRLDCDAFKAQVEALRNFAARHDKNLLEYNACIADKRDFRGHRHPSLAEKIRSTKSLIQNASTFAK
jgi:phosphoglycerol transferase MdoB-like AlkP superfamily enzyme